MRAILLLTTALTACLCFGQTGVSIGFTSDFQANGAWYPEFGGKFGWGAHNMKFDSIPFNQSFHFNLGVSGARRHSRIDQVVFDLEDSDEQLLGFARAEFQKTTMAFTYDFGYHHRFGPEFSSNYIISPYVSIGPRLENYRVRAHYEVYSNSNDACYCTHPTKEPISNFWSLGADLQTGVKFMFYSIGVDVRAGYYMGWSIGENYLPQANSFDIDAYGAPQFEHRSNKFNRGFSLSINLIFKINPYSPGVYRSGSSSYYDWEDSDDDNDDDDGGSSSSESSGSGCGGGLSPAGRGGG